MFIRRDPIEQRSKLLTTSFEKNEPEHGSQSGKWKMVKSCVAIFALILLSMVLFVGQHEQQEARLQKLDNLFNDEKESIVVTTLSPNPPSTSSLTSPKILPSASTSIPLSALSSSSSLRTTPPSSLSPTSTLLPTSSTVSALQLSRELDYDLDYVNQKENVEKTTAPSTSTSSLRVSTTTFHSKIASDEDDYKLDFDDENSFNDDYEKKTESALLTSTSPAPMTFTTSNPNDFSTKNEITIHFELLASDMMYNSFLNSSKSSVILFSSLQVESELHVLKEFEEVARKFENWQKILNFGVGLCDKIADCRKALNLANNTSLAICLIPRRNLVGNTTNNLRMSCEAHQNTTYLKQRILNEILHEHHLNDYPDWPSFSEIRSYQCNYGEIWDNFNLDKSSYALIFSDNDKDFEVYDLLMHAFNAGVNAKIVLNNNCLKQKALLQSNHGAHLLTRSLKYKTLRIINNYNISLIEQQEDRILYSKAMETLEEDLIVENFLIHLMRFSGSNLAISHLLNYLTVCEVESTPEYLHKCSRDESYDWKKSWFGTSSRLSSFFSFRNKRQADGSEDGFVTRIQKLLNKFKSTKPDADPVDPNKEIKDRLHRLRSKESESDIEIKRRLRRLRGQATADDEFIFQMEDRIKKLRQTSGGSGPIIPKKITKNVKRGLQSLAMPFIYALPSIIDIFGMIGKKSNEEPEKTLIVKKGEGACYWTKDLDNIKGKCSDKCANNYEPMRFAISLYTNPLKKFKKETSFGDECLKKTRRAFCCKPDLTDVLWTGKWQAAYESSYLRCVYMKRKDVEYCGELTCTNDEAKNGEGYAANPQQQSKTIITGKGCNEVFLFGKTGYALAGEMVLGGIRYLKMGDQTTEIPA